MLHLTSASFAAYLLLNVFTYTAITLSKAPKLDESIPWVGVGKGPFARWMAHLRELTRGKEMLAEGYFTVRLSLYALNHTDFVASTTSKAFHLQRRTSTSCLM